MKEAPQFLVKVTQDAQGHIGQADWYERADHATIYNMSDALTNPENNISIAANPDVAQVEGSILSATTGDSLQEIVVSSAKSPSRPLTSRKGIRAVFAGVAALVAANIPGGFMNKPHDAFANTPAAPGISQNIGHTDGGNGPLDSRTQVRPIENNPSNQEKILLNAQPESSKSTGGSSMAAVVSTPDGEKYAVTGGIDAASGKIVLRTKGQVGINGTYSISASETGVVAVSSFGGPIEVFDGKGRSKIITDTNKISDINVSPDGTVAFVSHADGSFAVIDLALGSLSSPISSQVTGQSTQSGVLRGTSLLQTDPGKYRNYGTRVDTYGYVQVDYSDSLVKATQYGASEQVEFFRTRVASYKDSITGKDVIFGINGSTSSNEVDKIYKYADNALIGIYPLSNTLTNPLDIAIFSIVADTSKNTGYAAGVRYNENKRSPSISKFQLDDPSKQASISTQGLPTYGEINNIFNIRQGGISKLLVEFLSQNGGNGYYAFDEATNSWEIVPIFTSDTTIYIPAASTNYT